MKKVISKLLGPPRRRRFLTAAATACAVGAALTGALAMDWLHTARLTSASFLFEAGSGRSAICDERIVLIAIDEKSLEELGQFSSWSRSYYTEVINRLSESNSRVVVFDVMFAEKAEGDEALATAIARAGNVILPVAVGARPGVSTGAFTGNNLIYPLQSLADAALTTGHAEVLPDRNGVVRSFPAVLSDGEGDLPALSIAAVAKYLRRPADLEAVPGGLALAGRVIPVGVGGEVIINYVGGKEVAVKTISFADVLNSRVAAEELTDRLVIIGATATALSDRYLTPIGRLTNGVEIHVQAINMILNNQFLQDVPSVVEGLIIIAFSLAAAVAVWRFRPGWAVVATFTLGLAYVLALIFAFERGFMMDMLYPPLALAGGFVSAQVCLISSERAQKKDLALTFGKYVSSSVAKQIMAAMDKGELALGGQEQEVTVLFADVRGFTRLAEAIPTGPLVSALNTYLSALCAAVLNNEGTVNNFAGDSILAIWNAPSPCPEHARKAVDAACEMQNAAAMLKKSDPSLPDISFGIGINTGTAIAGNMGSPNRLEYTVIGDAVNVAFRLTTQTPAGGIWMGERTVEMAGGGLDVSPLPAMEVKGRREPVAAYELKMVNKEDCHENGSN